MELSGPSNAKRGGLLRVSQDPNMYRTSYNDMCQGREVSVQSDFPSGYGGHVPVVGHQLLFKNCKEVLEIKKREKDPSRDSFGGFEANKMGYPYLTKGAKGPPGAPQGRTLLEHYRGLPGPRRGPPGAPEGPRRCLWEILAFGVFVGPQRRATGAPNGVPCEPERGACGSSCAGPCGALKGSRGGPLRPWFEEFFGAPVGAFASTEALLGPPNSEQQLRRTFGVSGAPAAALRGPWEGFPVEPTRGPHRGSTGAPRASYRGPTETPQGPHRGPMLALQGPHRGPTGAPRDTKGAPQGPHRGPTGASVRGPWGSKGQRPRGPQRAQGPLKNPGAPQKPRGPSGAPQGPL
ncbi:hypothetical protein ETH_00007000, partial [Eimeria tenella]